MMYVHIEQIMAAEFHLGLPLSDINKYKGPSRGRLGTCPLASIDGLDACAFLQ